MLECMQLLMPAFTLRVLPADTQYVHILMEVCAAVECLGQATMSQLVARPAAAGGIRGGAV
jgi:hypothetical protein